MSAKGAKLVTGDLVDSNHTDMEKAMEFIRGAVLMAPVYYVTGNHEKWLGEDTEAALLELLEQEGVNCLNNGKEEIRVKLFPNPLLTIMEVSFAS